MKVKVVKNGQEKGWFKNHVTGIHALLSHCRINNDDITLFELRDYDNPDIIIWSGKDQETED